MTGAPAILLIQGLGTPLTRWPQTLVDRLVDAGHRVIRFDNRDSGLSSKLDAPGTPHLARFLAGQAVSPLYALTDMAADAIALLDALRIEKAHIVGASMGGMIGQIVAARYPERCLSLTSIMSSSGNPLLPPPTPAAQQALIAPLPFPHGEKVIVQDAVRRQQVLMSPGYPAPEAELEAMFTFEFRRGFHPAGVARQLAALMTGGDRRPLLAGIRVPCMVLHGREDPLIPFACGVDTAKAIPTAELRVLPGMGHDFPFALASQFSDAILSAARRA
ncbi:MAG: alpha/beta hydrolase [Zoogloeaceae bacterium]|nr:alpha/beta hydrolase [Zoogloeaceae bacterium]